MVKTHSRTRRALNDVPENSAPEFSNRFSRISSSSAARRLGEETPNDDDEQPLGGDDQSSPLAISRCVQAATAEMYATCTFRPMRCFCEVHSAAFRLKTNAAR